MWQEICQSSEERCKCFDQDRLNAFKKRVTPFNPFVTNLPETATGSIVQMY